MRFLGRIDFPDLVKSVAGNGPAPDHTRIALSNMARTLPKLPFGQIHAPLEQNLRRFEFVQGQVHSALSSYEPSRKPFQYRSAKVTLPSLRIVASAHTPVRVEVGSNTDMTILIPFTGWSTATVGCQLFRAQAGVTALYLPAVARSGESGRRSLLSLSFQRERIEQAATSMFADASPSRHFQFDEPRLLPLSRCGLNVLSMLRQACRLVDTAALDPAAVDLLGAEDLFCRAIALLLSSDTALAAALKHPTRPNRGVIEQLCDYIDGNLTGPITMGDLERESGLKPRAIQLGFQRHFACTPSEWILNRRLDAARRLLIAGSGDTRIAEVAFRCGFPRPAAFSAAYRQRFGEQPNVTLRRR